MKSPVRYALAAVLCSLAACLALPARADTVGSGNVISETRPVSGFHGVELSGSGNLTVTQGDSEGLVIEAEDNLLPLIVSEVKDGTLHLGFKPNERIKTTKPIRFRLAVKSVDQLTLAGSGDVHAVKLSAPTETFHLGGSGDIAIDHLETGSLTTELAGSGDITFAGSAKEQTTEIDGSGDYDAGGLHSETATVTIDGSGDCTLWADKTLQVSVNGSGEVDYFGSPTVVQHVAGSGKIHSRGARVP